MEQVIKLLNKFKGANFQTDSSKVKLRGKFLKSKRQDMPTMLWFPEILDQADNSADFFTHKLNKVC